MSSLYHERLAATGDIDYDPRSDSAYDDCPDCTCCSLLGCYRGPDSGCPTLPDGGYLCPCTEG